MDVKERIYFDPILTRLLQGIESDIFYPWETTGKQVIGCGWQCCGNAAAAANNVLNVRADATDWGHLTMKRRRLRNSM